MAALNAETCGLQVYETEPDPATGEHMGVRDGRTIGVCAEPSGQDGPCVPSGCADCWRLRRLCGAHQPPLDALLLRSLRTIPARIAR